MGFFLGFIVEHFYVKFGDHSASVFEKSRGKNGQKKVATLCRRRSNDTLLSELLHTGKAHVSRNHSSAFSSEVIYARFLLSHVICVQNYSETWSTLSEFLLVTDRDLELWEWTTRRV